MNRIRVALADDSSFIRQAVAHLLSSAPDIQLVGCAACGEDLLQNLESWAPDTIVLDLSMPGMGGLDVLEAIMRRRPTPVIILSTHSQRGAPLTLEALDRGAVDFIDKQEYSLVDFDRLRDVLLTRLRNVSGTCRRPVEPVEGARPQAPPPLQEVVPPEAILLGASTGGPPAIERILTDLGPVKTPVLVAQHMPGSYIRAFAERLDQALPLAVCEAQDGMPLAAGTVVLAPGGMHLEIVRGAGLRIRLSTQPVSLYHPSVDVLFCSAAEHLGAACLAALLTGMGQDGAEGMRQLSRRGAFTIAQNQATSIVFGMPRAAIELGGAREILPLPAIGLRLRQLLAPPYLESAF